METNPADYDGLSEFEVLDRRYNRIATEINAILLQYPHGLTTTELLKGVCEYFKCTEAVARTALARTETYTIDGVVFLRDA